MTTVDDDFDDRPTIPRAARSSHRPVLLELSNEDFARGWIGRRPSFASHVPPVPLQRRSSRAVLLAPLLFGAVLLGGLVWSRLNPPPRVTSCLEAIAVAAKVEKSENAVEPAVVAVPNLEPRPVVMTAPKPPEVKFAPPAPKVEIAPLPKLAVPKPVEAKAALAPIPTEAAPATAEPEPPVDPNLGVVNAGF